jgi:phage terminase small subunit
MYEEMKAARLNDELGPCMMALRTDQQREFVRQLFIVPAGHGCLTAAARAAGYGKSRDGGKSKEHGVRQTASKLAQDPRIAAAIAEESKRQLRGAAPEATRALINLIRDPTHKDHARAIAMVLDRIDPIETTHHVEVRRSPQEIVVATEAVLAKIAAYAAQAGLDPIQQVEFAKTIDGTAEEVTDDEK